MRYALNTDVSFCRAGDRLVFLDVAHDRYFSLPGKLERTLSDYLAERGGSSLDLQPLIARGILIEHAGAQASNAPVIEPVRSSAMERPAMQDPLRAGELVEVFAIVLRTRIALRFAKLKDNLHRLAAGRPDPGASEGSPPQASDDRIFRAAATFRRARLFVPVEMRCLLDSLALLDFLHRRGFRASLVFGVASDPFTAHCWVQAGDCVLNDTVGSVTAHTLIRVV